MNEHILNHRLHLQQRQLRPMKLMHVDVDVDDAVWADNDGNWQPCLARHRI
jgi:hypothetical protein